MNKLIIDKNKVLSYKGLSTLYAGEIDFEQLRVEMPKTIGRIKTRDYRDSGAKLVIVTSSTEYETALTFTLSDDRTGYISQIIPVDADWCQHTGVIYAYVQFGDAESALGLTNAVAINVMSNVNDDIPAPSDPFARKSYVDESVEGLASEEYVDDVVSSKANDDEVIHTTGDETKTGNLTIQARNSTAYAQITKNGFIAYASGRSISFNAGYITRNISGESSRIIAWPNQTGTLALTSDIPEGVIYAGVATAYADGALTVTLSDVMKTKMNTTDNTANVSLAACDDVWNNTVVSTSSSFLIGTLHIHAKDLILFYQTPSGNTYSIIRRAHAGGQFNYHAHVLESASEPPSSSSYFYREGSIWYDTGWHRAYICTGVSESNGTYTYTWRRFTDAPEITYYLIPLSANGWENNEQTVAVADVTYASHVFLSFDPSSMEQAMETPVYMVAQGEGTVTFKCTGTPTDTISVILEVRN